MEKKVLVSIIIPFYNGNDYMNDLIFNMNELKEKNYCSFEVIFVNDSPECDIIMEIKPLFDFRIIINEKNQGIQKTRINGLKKAKGEYIVFLDQDDRIVVENFNSQIKKIEGYDVCVGNGLYEINSKERKIFNNQKALDISIKKTTLLLYGTTIISPGQCLIRRDAIPEEWTQTVLTINGADDEFLWLLMIVRNEKFITNKEIVYIHKETGVNLSTNVEKMARSSLEYEKKVFDMNLLNKIEHIFFIRRRTYKIKRYLSNNKLLVNLQYPDICLFALFIKIINK